MTDDILIAPPEFKLYKDRAIYIGTFIGGPLTAGYLIAENYRQLGEKGKIWKTWVIAAVFTILTFIVAFLIPAASKIPSILFPLLYAGLTSLVVKRLQGDQIRAHAGNNGEFYTTWRGAVVGLIFCAITVGVLFLILSYAM